MHCGQYVQSMWFANTHRWRAALTSFSIYSKMLSSLSAHRWCCMTKSSRSFPRNFGMVCEWCSGAARLQGRSGWECHRRGRIWFTRYKRSGWECQRRGRTWFTRYKSDIIGGPHQCTVCTIVMRIFKVSLYACLLAVSPIATHFW